MNGEKSCVTQKDIEFYLECVFPKELVLKASFNVNKKVLDEWFGKAEAAFSRVGDLNCYAGYKFEIIFKEVIGRLVKKYSFEAVKQKAFELFSSETRLDDMGVADILEDDRLVRNITREDFLYAIEFAGRDYRAMIYRKSKRGK